MSLFGVELNVQLNRIVQETRMKISNARTKIFVRNIVSSCYDYDTQAAGVIHLEDFERVLQDNRILLKKWEYQVILKAFPADLEKGYLHWEKFVNALVVPLDPEREALVHQIWDHVDSREEGALHYQELGQLLSLKHMVQYRDGLRSEEQLKNDFFRKMRFDEAGKLSKAEFVLFYQDLNCNFPSLQGFSEFAAAMWSFPLALTKAVRPEEVKALVREFRFKLIQQTQKTHEQFLLKQVFDEYDREKVGKLSVEDLRGMSVKLDIPLEERLLRPLFTRFDKNGSGAIEYHEFKNFLFFDPYPI